MRRSRVVRCISLLDGIGGGSKARRKGKDGGKKKNTARGAAWVTTARHAPPQKPPPPRSPQLAQVARRARSSPDDVTPVVENQTRAPVPISALGRGVSDLQTIPQRAGRSHRHPNKQRQPSFKAKKDAILQSLHDGKNPYKGFGDLTDEDAAAVLLTMELRRRSGTVGRRQVAAMPSECAHLSQTLKVKLKDLESSGFDVGVEALNACLYILKQHSLTLHCQGWLRWMQKAYMVAPNTKSYNLLLSSFVVTQPDDVIPTFKQMLQKGPQPDTVTYGILLRVIDYGNVRDVLNLKEDRGFPANAVDYNIIIGRASSFEEAKTWFDEMQAKSFPCDKFTLGGLLKACAHSGEIKNAEWAFETAREAGVVLETTLYTALMGVYKSAQDYDGLTEVWTRMLQAGMKPDAHSYLTKVRLLKSRAVKAGDESMCRLEETVTSAELSGGLNPTVWEEVFNSYAKIGDAKGAQRMGRLMLDVKSKLPRRLLDAYRAAALQEFTTANLSRDQMAELWVTRESTYASRKMRR
eukprot:TRINITY_DN27008_c0_g1_i1.p1 TRINITY_DN27008_c0_g1~~TRINITY_DN27008_c0_g1_i1.p1  ORF type:complete len:522 (+),score=37.05 TRINITY_DN27008_c0_g1_i1:47-1612(+)